MPWQIKWDTTTIELTQDPANVIDDNPAKESSADYPGDLPVLIGIGKNVRKLTIEGYLYDPAKTKDQLKTDIIDPLRTRIGKTVELAQTARYNGTWMLYNVKPKEERGFTKSYRYTMEFHQGSQYVVL